MIFLIDDDEIQNLINSKVIEVTASGLDVQAFTSAEKALEVLESGKNPSLIFLDINMPKMNGWDFLDACAEKGLTPRIYMLSSSINNKDIARSETYDIVRGFICKPLVVERLQEILGTEQLA